MNINNKENTPVDTADITVAKGLAKVFTSIDKLYRKFDVQSREQIVSSLTFLIKDKSPILKINKEIELLGKSSKANSK